MRTKKNRRANLSLWWQGRTKLERKRTRARYSRLWRNLDKRWLDRHDRFWPEPPPSAAILRIRRIHMEIDLRWLIKKRRAERGINDKNP